MQFNGLSVKRQNDTIFIPLPREAWREIKGGCKCPCCGDGVTAYWDTIAIDPEKPKDGGRDTTWTVHYPELHR